MLSICQATLHVQVHCMGIVEKGGISSTLLLKIQFTVVEIAPKTGQEDELSLLWGMELTS